MEYRIKDISLADKGKKKIEWAESHMPVLLSLMKKYEDSKPLKDVVVGGCLHVTKETAVLTKTLAAAGATVAWSGCNPLSTNDDIAASLVKDEGLSIFASRGVNNKEYYDDIYSVLKFNPDITIDDGADLTIEFHKNLDKYGKNIKGGTEETTTGVQRLKALEKNSKLGYPIVAVNDAETKHDFDNVYGTGQSALDGIIRATNVLLSGKTVVVAGYGHVGKGIASRARGFGASVIVTEIDPINALKARMDGFMVKTMQDAASAGDVFITSTGCKDVITGSHFETMKDGVILANAGHFNVEISIDDLTTISKSSKAINENVEQYILNNQKKVNLIGEGRLVNLVAAEGHPSEVMDMSFANQFLSVLNLVKNKGKFENRIYNIDKEQDLLIASLKLESMGISIDKLSESQNTYINEYGEGT
ncbi:MAG: adenosylhomocysteinase [Candidatus Nitrosocosmicus sp.]|jgi:adenosylhomocysteinase|uniref:adenosylhomocysteinase n=1 Tax=Candidatus Nitrosocosmicus agrestis TaxID=2563600 RepID=UPI00122E333F|nr:adenosylhomocysteinase [Candidatus Nitrosocosmicus sp. SS]KAA2282741.1 adenosylhomocysteinase [Candidatus Nitrosocosmicus sp. SS]KAF0870326.1 adenosylhomocysteinase [Candidatus Nitrosocosmicus sp. SS]